MAQFDATPPIKYGPLFRKYQKPIKDFSNTDDGRKFLDIPSDIERVDFIDRNSVAQILSVNHKTGGVKIRRVFYTRNKFLLKIRNSMTFDYLEILDENNYQHLLNNKASIYANLDPYHPGVRKIGYPTVFFDAASFNPDADPESTSVDGEVGVAGKTDTWNDIRNASGTTSNSSGGTPSIYMTSSSTTDRWDTLRRCPTLFDTSSLDDDAVIDSADYIIQTSSFQARNFGTSVNAATCDPASNTTLAASDYNIANWGSTKLSSDKALSSISGSSSFTLALNASGLSAISKTGITKIGIILSEDLDNSAPTWQSSTAEQLGWYSADSVGNEPELSLVYSFVSNLSNPIFFSSGGLGVA